ncbi:hypothetical protein VTI28DRAFT_8819 [Corynascus sepedonium]
MVAGSKEVRKSVFPCNFIVQSLRCTCQLFVGWLPDAHRLKRGAGNDQPLGSRSSLGGNKPLGDTSATFARFLINATKRPHPASNPHHDLANGESSICELAGKPQQRICFASALHLLSRTILGRPGFLFLLQGPRHGTLPLPAFVRHAPFRRPDGSPTRLRCGSGQTRLNSYLLDLHPQSGALSNFMFVRVELAEFVPTRSRIPLRPRLVPYSGAYLPTNIEPQPMVQTQTRSRGR